MLNKNLMFHLIDTIFSLGYVCLNVSEYIVKLCQNTIWPLSQPCTKAYFFFSMHEVTYKLVIYVYKQRICMCSLQLCWYFCKPLVLIMLIRAPRNQGFEKLALNEI